MLNEIVIYIISRVRCLNVETPIAGTLLDKIYLNEFKGNQERAIIVKLPPPPGKFRTYFTVLKSVQLFVVFSVKVAIYAPRE